MAGAFEMRDLFAKSSAVSATRVVSILLERTQPATRANAMTTSTCLAGAIRLIGERERTDQQLLDRFALVRDESAFAELVRRHGPMVLAVCRRVLRHEQDAEDACQAAFLVLARKADAIRQGQSVAGWLYRVAQRLAVRCRTSREFRRARTLPLTSEPVALESAPGLVGAALEEEVQRLPERYRAVVMLCYLERQRQAEVAVLLATTEDAVNSRLKRARDLLRQRLARRGLALSSVAVVERLTASAAQAALPPMMVRSTTSAAVQFATQVGTSGAVSSAAASLAKGALNEMSTPITKILVPLLLALAVTLVGTGAWLLPATGQSETNKSKPQAAEVPKQAKAPEKQANPKPSCILLWMAGGPSQIDTFDPKPEDPNGKLFGAIDTDVKGVKISQNLPRLAKLMSHLTIIRSLTHREGDHNRATALMRTGYTPNAALDYPSVASVLALKLGEGRPGVPAYFSTSAMTPAAGFLGERYAPLPVRGASHKLPAIAAFEAVAPKQGEKLHKAIAPAFDLNDEKAETRIAYGLNHFGQSCLLARRLVERDVPVVELILGGWDNHTNLDTTLPKVTAQLDAGMSALIQDLKDRKRLDSTLVVWMGEFGRTPRINTNSGRDHWPWGFSVVLAGRGIKGGQVIGKTSADGMRVEEDAVTPAEFLATIYQALGVDATKTLRTPEGKEVPLVEKGTRAVKAALR